MEKEVWYIHQLTHNELKIFVKEACTQKNNDKAFVGIIAPAAIQRIETVCGKKVEKIMLESGAIRHSYNKEYHLLEEDDIFHYVDVVNTAVDIRLSGKKHLNNDVITFTKDINGQILFATEIRVNHGGWLSLVTCYRLHKKDKVGRCSMLRKSVPEAESSETLRPPPYHQATLIVKI